MPGSYRILPGQGIVYVEYRGKATLSEAKSLLNQYSTDPERRMGQRQLIDLSRITDWEKDFLGLMKYQADSAARIFSPHGTMMMVIYAPTGPGKDLGRHLVQTWSAVSGAVVTLQVSESAALSVLGQPEKRIAELLAKASHDPRYA
ncbi:hypothetical protein [Maritimibacter sp. DP1N21-5]|uniref:hypothetical protein n=1 Tax=Maritimibacter sp. DP1N21-5 TaxID=2836867 RepID=UPI001C47C736|nr:hypothetical protein [Maritimibacter sp. DP1N21-5]MBV7410002.1 hypothetical protein [Maritimibacter sp. DP1N21-5]